jgi:hypothetical protein
LILKEIEYKNYFSTIPNEINSIIMSKLSVFDKTLLYNILNETGVINQEILNYFNVDKIYDTTKDDILLHPYVQSFYNEIINLLDSRFIIDKHIIKLEKDEFIKIMQYIPKIGQTGYHKKLYAKIDPDNFNVYRAGSKKIMCNLHDEPWHCLDYISSDNGYIDTSSFGRQIKIKELEHRKNK